MKKKIKNLKLKLPVTFLVVVIIFLGVIACLLPIKSKKAFVVTQNLHVEKIGVLWTYEENQEISLLNGDVFTDYFFNESRGMSFKEFKNVFSYNTDYDLYTVSFELKNNSPNTLGLFSIESNHNDSVVVYNYLDNEEVVFIEPGEIYLVGLRVYVNRDTVPNPDDDFILEQIDKICFSEIRSTSNIDIFAAEFKSVFYEDFFSLN